MSRIGNTPISLPSGVQVEITSDSVTVKGPKGTLFEPKQPGVSVSLANEQVIVKRIGKDRQSKANHGLMNRLIYNMIVGVTDGFSKKLQLVGTGYRARMQGQGIAVLAGYSHPIEYTPPEGINLVCEGETVIVVSGIHKQMVGQVAAEIRAIRPPEPYKGKGIRYHDEIVRRKAGKATKVGAAA